MARYVAQRSSAIKSIQRGEYQGSSSASTTITISPVNLNKSVLHISSEPGYTEITGEGVFASFYAAKLTNATTITLTRAWVGNLSKCCWQVVEYY